MSKENIYIHETHTIWSDNGEVYLETDNQTIVFNASNLLKDLDPLVHLTFEEVNKEQKRVKQSIKQTLKKI